MPAIDWKKALKHLYNPPAKEVVVVDVPPLSFLMVDGAGDPNKGPEFGQALEALYSLSYALKFMVKKGPLAVDYRVAPPEGLWWAEDMAQFSLDNKGGWLWTAMLMQPECVTAALVEEAREQVARKRNPPALARVRLQVYHEGLSAQIMHLGPYASEGPTIARLHAFISEQGCEPAGKHHEIYLSDPRRCAPEKIKTVLRQPMRRGDG